jgi:hypothetical protein
MKTSVYLAVLSALSLQAGAHQHGSVPHSGDPARSSGALYDSAFRSYMPWHEQKLAAWKELNDEVHRIGGHVGILRGASASDGKESPVAASAPARATATEHSPRAGPRPTHDETTKPGHRHEGRK